METISILVVDDHPMVLEGMQAMLSQLSYVNVIGLAKNAEEAQTQIRNQMPDIVITDISMPDISGIELTDQLKKEFPKIKIIAMSTSNERSIISQMVQKGASGYLLKSASQQQIEDAILTVHANKLYLSLDLGITKNEQNEFTKVPTLTSREKEVLNLIAEGFTNTQIADKLFVSPHTVDSHRKNLLAKFKVNNTAGLIKSAAKHGFVS